MNTKNNQRSRDTDEKIVRAVYDIMMGEKKSIGKVTVREVCERAGINRSTFYAHYMDVFDVLEKVEKTMSENLTRSFLEQIDSGSDISQCFESLFEFIREYREFYKVYLNGSNRAGVIGLAWELMRDKLNNVTFQEFGFRSQRELEYHGAFFLFGMTAMIRQWVSDGCPESPREMCGILSRQYNTDRSLFDWGNEA